MNNEERAAKNLEDGSLKVVEIGTSASTPPPCDVCGRTMPAIRQGGIECHHDGTYTPLASPVGDAELARWRALGAEMMSDVEVGNMTPRASIRGRLKRLLDGDALPTDPTIAAS